MTDPEHPCRVMPTRSCPRAYAGVCGDRPCARFESDDETPWLPELPAQAATLTGADDLFMTVAGEFMAQYRRLIDAEADRLLAGDGTPRGILATSANQPEENPAEEDNR